MEAQLMAGRAAAGRQGWDDAKAYFLSLYNNTNGPAGTEVQQRFNDLRLQALFAYGQTLMSHLDPAETNKLANCEEATRVFGRVYDESPTNRLAVQALLEKGPTAIKEWALARQQYDSLTNALNAYEQVLHSPQADVAARSEAKVGQAVVLEKWAEQKTGKERTALLEQALNNCLDVVYGKILRDDEKLHELWTKEAGLKGFGPRRRLAGLVARGRPLPAVDEFRVAAVARLGGEASQGGAGEAGAGEREPLIVVVRSKRTGWLWTAPCQPHPAYWCS